MEFVRSAAAPEDNCVPGTEREREKEYRISCDVLMIFGKLYKIGLSTHFCE